ncbi:hypothetical protein SNE40_015741 [Patella caerulea]|uniref:FHA domain-containing protein n=1 Tax=Patella caerulea TaxID=87958 RepID=A0AAN8PJR7_PATCE
MAADGTTRWRLRRLGPSASCANVCDVMRLKNGITRFGRSLDNDFYLDSKTHKNFISRHHAEIRFTKINGKPEFVLYDHGLNGTFINDVRMEKSCVLKEGDKITFGHTNGFKIDPGQHSKQPNSEFQFTFEKLDDDDNDDDSDESSDDSGPESDSNPQNDHLCNRNLYNSPEYDRSQCWQQGQVQKNNLNITKKSDCDQDATVEFAKGSIKNNTKPRSPRGKKGNNILLGDICANNIGKNDHMLKTGSASKRQNGLNNVKDENLEPPVLKNQTTLCYSDNDKSDDSRESSSGQSSESETNTNSDKSEDKSSSSDSEPELTIDTSVKQPVSAPKTRRKTASARKRRPAQTTPKRTVTKKPPVPINSKSKTKTKAATTRVDNSLNNKSKNTKEPPPPVNHNINSPSRRILFNKTSPANGKSDSIKSDIFGDPYDFNSDEESVEVSVEPPKGKNNSKKISSQSDVIESTKTAASMNKNGKTAIKNNKPAVNSKRKKPAVAPKRNNKRAKASSDDYGDEIIWYEGETCTSDNCLRPSDKTVEWVQCDDCDQWYHTMCVGAIYAAVKDTQMEFHCGC